MRGIRIFIYFKVQYGEISGPINSDHSLHNAEAKTPLVLISCSVFSIITS